MGTAAALPSRVTPTPGDAWQSPPPTLDGPTLPVVQRHWGSSHVSGNLQNHGSAPDLTDRALDGSSPKTAPAAGVPGPPRRGRHGSAFRSLVKNRTANGTQMTPVDQNPHRTTRLAWTPDRQRWAGQPLLGAAVCVCVCGVCLGASSHSNPGTPGWQGGLSVSRHGAVVQAAVGPGSLGRPGDDTCGKVEQVPVDLAQVPHLILQLGHTDAQLVLAAQHVLGEAGVRCTAQGTPPCLAEGSP